MSADLDALPAIPRDAEGPVFRAPWEAQAFGMAVMLHERGHVTWKEWAQRLADEIAAATSRGESDDGTRYYYFWLAALEKLVADKRLVLAMIRKMATLIPPPTAKKLIVRRPTA